MTQMTQMARLSVLAMVATVAIALPAAAQSQPARPSTSRSIEIGGYAMVGNVNFAASESFDAILATSTGPIFGGGATVSLPFGGLFVEIGAWQFSDPGTRVVIFEGQVFPLGIPLDVTILPVEMSAGWKFRIRRLPTLIPYVAGGYTSFGYRETSSFAGAGEDVEDRFGGYHLRGGAEIKIARWVGLAGEWAWTTVPGALASGGASAVFNEDNLGGTSFRVRITVGR